MTKPKIAVISASLGGFDVPREHITQSIKYDYFLFTDDNFPPRFNAMTPRLQAKIPKFFGWQLRPGFDYYLWIDGNLNMIRPDSLNYFLKHIKNYDIVVLKHPRRNTVKWEARYTQRGLNQGSRYLAGRYINELLEEQMKEINDDTEFMDDLLVIGGVFMYKNTPEVQEMLKQWWYHVSRYLIMDQCSFSYVLKKSGLRINALGEDVYHSEYLCQNGHVKHY